MANDWLQHKQLAIVRGVYAAPGDTSTSEPAIVTLNLMSNNTGIALKSDGWSPNIPSLKDSGVWADSPISDGRRLISGVNSNVVETMQLTITGATFQDVTAWLSALRNMMQDARDFWQANAQISPVYLKWWASCGAGAQYALIYSMDMKPTYVQSPTPTLDVTLTIERECFWRFIPPGGNAKQWTYEFNNQPYNYTKSGLASNDSLVPGVFINARSEFNAGFTALVSTSYLPIAANLIPGDAPALMTLVLNNGTTRTNFMVGKKTVKIPLTNSIAQNNIYTATDGTLGTDATRVNDAGAVKPAGGVNAQRVEISFATATNQLRWRMLNANTNSVNRQIGRYQVFLRCRQNGGATGDIIMYLRYGFQVASDSDGIKLNVVSPPAIAGGGASTNWGLVYMGIITLPITPAKGMVVGSAALGTGLTSALNTLDFGLFALRSTGAGVLYICDLILVPVDEGSITLEIADASADTGMIYDNTNFLSHGTNEEIVANGVPINTKLVKYSGMGIQLTPYVENRLYVIAYDTSNQSQTGDTIVGYVDIIPRCQGIRGIEDING